MIKQIIIACLLACGLYGHTIASLEGVALLDGSKLKIVVYIPKNSNMDKANFFKAAKGFLVKHSNLNSKNATYTDLSENRDPISEKKVPILVDFDKKLDRFEWYGDGHSSPVLLLKVKSKKVVLHLKKGAVLKKLRGKWVLPSMKN